MKKNRLKRVMYPLDMAKMSKKVDFRMQNGIILEFLHSPSKLCVKRKFKVVIMNNTSP